ncbi:MAG: hypothetical protein H6733_16715 [Alphaproteobacteria bacterium]|nr:hypothetical protein [Alphaproteobacteria bacterium]
MSDETEETDETPIDATPKARPSVAPSGILQRPSDAAVRPGFRSPANSRSKAQKAGKKKKK